MKYTADFETTTTAPARVWAWEVDSVDSLEVVGVGTDISSFFEFLETFEKNPTIYFHNLKFDGSFILDYLLKNGWTWKNEGSECLEKEFSTLITDLGIFYSITCYFSRKGKKVKKVEFRDSLKLLNFPVRSVAKCFNLPMSKGDIDYTRHDTPCAVTPEEWDYLHRDVGIMARAMQHLESMGMNKMTVASCALADYKLEIGEKRFKQLFPVLPFDVDAKIRKAYRGGWTYCNSEISGLDIGHGIVLDVNSLYPFVMHECPLPYGKPRHFSGKYTPTQQYPLYVQNLRCAFTIKSGKLPTIQIKNRLGFMPNQYLTSSANQNGELEIVDLCLTNVDLELFFNHYNVEFVEYRGGYCFKQSTELFRNWVDKWAQEKINADLAGNKALRTICKLMLNNLYGKFATNPIKRGKRPVLDTENNCVKYEIIKYQQTDENGNPIFDKDGTPKMTMDKLEDSLYIPVGVFVTAWARHKTITTAQKCHDQGRFCYSDTDSIHLMGFEEPRGIDIHPTRLGAWKKESMFSRARFLQSKRYIEYVLEEGENWNVYSAKNVTCCGMPSACYNGVTWENFHIGTVYQGKLQHKTVDGGTILIPIEFALK